MSFFSHVGPFLTLAFWPFPWFQSIRLRCITLGNPRRERAHTHTHIHAHLSTDTHTHTYSPTHRRKHTNTHTRTYKHTRTHAHPAPTHTLTHTHAPTHTHAHSHTSPPRREVLLSPGKPIVALHSVADKVEFHITMHKNSRHSKQKHNPSNGIPVLSLHSAKVLASHCCGPGSIPAWWCSGKPCASHRCDPSSIPTWWCSGKPLASHCRDSSSIPGSVRIKIWVSCEKALSSPCRCLVVFSQSL